MGHDITAYKAEEIVYLRRAAFTGGKVHGFYAALGCESFDAGVSGDGRHVTVYLDALERAKAILEKNVENEYDQEYVDFVDKCIVEAKKDGTVIIYFG